MKKSSCLVMIWHTFLSIFEMLYARVQFLFFKKPIVTIFGGHKLPAGKEHLGEEIEEIAYQLVQCGLMIMTGGGGGVMKRAHEGACRATGSKKETVSIGISVKGLNESRGEVRCSDRLYMSTHTFFARKWILMRFSKVFFFFPGGFGTLDEFMEVMTLLKVDHMDKRKIVLYDKEYWAGFLNWAQKELVDSGFSGKKEMDYFVLVDTVDDAVRQLKDCCGCL